jgi:transcriptional regulator with XRE-family HTH domain
MDTSTLDGTRLRAARRTAGLSQADLAKRVGVEQPHISSMENGVRSPSVEVLRMLAAALGVSVHWLCGEDIAHAALPPEARPEALIEDPGASAGLIALAGDARLIQSLAIGADEWGTLRSLTCPTLTKEGYVAVLLAIRGHT